MEFCGNLLKTRVTRNRVTRGLAVLSLTLDIPPKKYTEDIYVCIVFRSYGMFWTPLDQSKPSLPILYKDPFYHLCV